MRNSGMINIIKLIHDMHPKLTAFLHPSSRTAYVHWLKNMPQPPSAEYQFKGVLRGIAVLGSSLALLRKTAVKQRGFGLKPD